MANDLRTGLDKISDAARAKSLLSPDWYAWLFESIEGGLLVTGAVCPLKMQGKNKGKPNFKQKDPRTLARVFLTSDECNAAAGTRRRVQPS